MTDFFAHPGAAYNAVSLLLTAAGMGLGTVGLAVAIWQLAKTRRAAVAAQMAAQTATAEVRRIAIVIDIQKLSAYCREVRASVGVSTLPQMSRPLHDLRVGLAELRSSPRGRSLAKHADWDQMIADVAAVQRQVEMPPEAYYDVGVVVRTVTEVVSQVDERLHGMAPRAAMSGGA